MLAKKNKPKVIKKRLQRLLLIIGIAGASTLITIPVLAKYYRPYSLFQPTASRGYPYRNSTRSIAATLAQDTKYANLVHGLKKAGIFDKLKTGRFTVFAPTNAAFHALSADQFKQYSIRENRIKVLNYHIVPGDITNKDVDKGSKITLEGSPIKINPDDNGYVKINNANGKHPSIVTKNGVIVEIDRVLFPN
ncbi:MAG: fasciclin domain-containing protein [Calothrix sp. MO_167.B12]|nr:fasciclin domain-containing protein [Calothrix sp. MO_167.B12]